MDDAGEQRERGAAPPAGGAHVRVELNPPAEVVRIARRLEEEGFETWAVGGGVRDALRNHTPDDWDLATAARPHDIQRIFRRTFPIGVEHGTIGVLGRDGHLYEVTTFRRDVETDGRRARVTFAGDIATDLERRDFTINAVAWHPLRGEVRDPHSGVEDLRRGVLRTVGDPSARFAEDRLRVLRALRFAGRFGLRIEPATWHDLVASADHLELLSAERIREELYKVLGGQDRPSTTLRLYAESGVLAALYPELHATVGFTDAEGGDLWSRALDTVDAIPRTRVVLRVAALLHLVGLPTLGAVERRAASGGDDAGDGSRTRVGMQHAVASAAVARRLLRRLRASNADVDRVTHLLAQQDSVPPSDAAPAQIRRWARRIGVEQIPDHLRLRIARIRADRGQGSEEFVRFHRRLRGVLREKPALSLGDLAIDGSDLRAVGIPPGPLYGEILRELLERVTDQPVLNRREQLLALVRQRMDGH